MDMMRSKRGLLRFQVVSKQDEGVEIVYLIPSTLTMGVNLFTT